MKQKSDYPAPSTRMEPLADKFKKKLKPKKFEKLPAKKSLGTMLNKAEPSSRGSYDTRAQDDETPSTF